MWMWYSSFSSVFIPDIRFGCADHPVNTPPFSLHNLPCRLFISTPYIHPTSPTCCIFVPHSCSVSLSSHIPILSYSNSSPPLLHSSHPVDSELKAFTFRSLISLGLFYSSPSWHAEYALDFSAHVSYITAAWLLSVCTCRLVGCCLLFPFLCVQWSVSVCALAGLVMHQHPCMSFSLFLHRYVCLCVCVCGWFYQLLQMAQSLIHRSTEMKSPLKSKGREERNGQTDMERVRGRWRMQSAGEMVEWGWGETCWNSKRWKWEEDDQKMERFGEVMQSWITRSGHLQCFV